MGQSSLGCEALPPLAGLCLYLKNAVMVFSLFEVQGFHPASGFLLYVPVYQKSLAL